ncbi:MAG: hypothetical protein AB1696_05855 [Planctomycetota bacterium]
MRTLCIVSLLMTLCLGVCPAQTYRAEGFEWKDPVQISLENPSDFPRESEVVILKASDLGIATGADVGRFRLVDPTGQSDEEGEVGGNNMPFQLDGQEFSFAVDLPAHEKKTLLLFATQDANAPSRDYAGSSDLTLDVQAGKIGNSLVSVDFSVPDKKSVATAINYKGEEMVPNVWLYVAGDRFRTQGPVAKIEVVCDGPVRRRVLLHRQPDLEAARDKYEFRIAIEVTRQKPCALMTIATLLKEQTALHADLYASVWKPDPKKDRLHFFHLDGTPKDLPPETKEAYGRMKFEVDPPWVCLFDAERKRGVGVGAPRGDVADYTFCIDLKRFELQRPHILASPSEPLVYTTVFDFGEDPQAMRRLHITRNMPVTATVNGKQCDMVDRMPTSRKLADDPMPKPDVAKAPHKRDLSPGVQDSPAGILASTNDMGLLIDKKTGAVRGVRCGGDVQPLAAPGGFCFVRWPDRKEIVPAGVANGWNVKEKAAAFSWDSDGVHRHDLLRAHDGCLEWTAEIENKGQETLLLETRFSLPLNAGQEGWCFWDSSFAYKLGKGAPCRGFTTLHPGERTCQGIFPAAAIWNRETGMAIGLRPMDIYSFYGAQADPTAGADRAFNSILRLVIPPGEKRAASFILYRIDPNWGWRSCLDRYYALFPEVFAAPTRDDVWGLYAATGPERVHDLGDKFIELCRRYRVGGMELYGPFTKTGEFYPDGEPCYERQGKGGKGVVTLNREQIKKVFEICNLASCNLSYVIPTKCNRDLAMEKYQDSIIKEKNGEFFLRDYWCVITTAVHAGGEEKLAAMFAYANQFGERLKNDIHRIVDNYKPDGFYFDNGSFVWEDYGRHLAFSSFDDSGQIYTNGGIPYAMIQEDLKTYSPHIHRNPGEFIQYFSGFRGQSHLTNCITTQTNYVRSHRFIMGNKPIFVGLPRDYENRLGLQKALVVGGLPWMCNMMSHRPHRMDLVRGFADVCIALARAGWRPIRGATSDAEGVRIERCGDGLESFFVMVNQNPTETSAAITVNSAVVGADGALVLGDFFGRVALKNRVDPKTGLTTVKLAIPPCEAVVLRAMAVVKEAKLPFAISSRINGKTMDYIVESGQDQQIHLALRQPFRMHFSDGKSDLVVAVAGQKTVALPLAADVAYHPDEEGVVQFKHLAKAEALRVVIPREHTAEEMANARRIKGFHEFQADLLKKDAAPFAIEPGATDLEGAVIIGLASKPEIRQVLQAEGIGFKAEGDTGIVAAIKGNTALLITSGTERGLREALWDYLFRIEAPLPNDDLRIEELAAPKAME